MENEKIRKIIDTIIHKATDIVIESNVDLDEEQIDLLLDLNRYCVNQVLGNSEVIKDPRKIIYKKNQEFLYALVGIVLAQSLTDPSRKKSEGKEFFEDNITIQTKGESVKYIDFGKIKPEHVREAIYLEIIEDWKIFRDREGLGITSLLDEKTNLAGLSGYKKGGDKLYEFARFHRKYTEKERRKEEAARESAQTAFRNAMVQAVATQVAQQQLLEGKNPMEIVEMLFAPNDKQNKKKIQRLTKSSEPVDPEIEHSITLMLEDHSESEEE